jgi:MSHA biogenesis protein MshQ
MTAPRPLSAPPHRVRPLALIAALGAVVALLLWTVPARAQSTIAYIASAAPAPTTGPVSSVTLKAPAGIVAGNLMVAFVAQNTTTLPAVSAAPSGWTEVLEQDNGASIGGSVYYKIATSADVAGTTTYTWTCSAAAYSGGVILAFSGVDNIAPVVVSGSESSAASGTWKAPSITPGVANTMLVVLFAGDAGSDAAMNNPAGTTKVYFGESGAATGGIALGAFYESLSASTATGVYQSSGNTSAVNIGAMLALQPAPAAAPAAASLWHFDETSWPATAGAVIDSSGNGYNGTAMAGATTASTSPAIAGNPGTCGYGTFNGSTQYVAINGPHLTGPFTVTAWIQPTVANSAGGRIFYDDTNFDGFALSFGDSGYTNKMRLYIREPATAIAQGTLALSLNTWYFVAGVLDATVADTISVYVMDQYGDILDHGSTAITGFTPSSSTVLAIGGNTNQSTETTKYRFQGTIDEVTTYTSALSTAQIQQLATQTHACGVITPDHFAISNAGTAVNCQASPVTITAVSSAQAPVATTGTITVSTSTGHGDWTLTTGGGTFTAGASNSGTATYTYVAADDGAVTLSLKDTYPETVTINVADGSITQKSGSALASQQLPLTFVASGFRITNGANVGTAIGTQVAGKSSTQSLALQAIRTDINTGACTAVFASGATVNVSLAYQCNNPVSCVAGQTLGITNNGVTTSIAGNPNSGVGGYTAVPLKFSTANAEAPFSLNYSDVGQITLDSRYVIPLGSGVGSGNAMNGSSQFVVQPYNFTLSNIKCTTYGSGTCASSLAAPGLNPGAATAAGPAFIAAGQPFSATVTALNFTGAATPNYGQEISPPGVALTANLVAPAGGDAAALNNAAAFGTFSAGVAAGSTFNWPEVGIITLTPGVANYLGSGSVTGSASGDVGRFIPNAFAAAENTPVFGTGCSAGSFSYLGQPLSYTVAPVITVTAQALGGATTRNYTGAFLKLTNSSLAGRTYTPTPATPTLNVSGLPPTTTDPAIADLGTGQATLTFSAGSGLLFNRTAAIAPFNANIALSLNVIDTDGVSASNPVTFGTGSGMNFSTGAAQYYGRLALRDGVGSELLNLPMTLTTQYYLSTAQGFTTNTADSCTAAPPISFSNYQLNLVVGETCVLDTGNPGTSGVGCAAPAAASLQYRAAAAAGNFNLILAAPGVGNAGALSVTATAPSWLQYSWGSTLNPVGMGTFGVFPGPTSRIHQREVY